MRCLLIVATAAALNNHHTQAGAPQQAQPSTDKLLCDPATKEPLAVKAQYFNGVTKKTYSSPTATYGTRFGFVDLAEAKRPRTAREIADELREQIIGRSAAQRVQEDTFRNPFVSFLYERGWRDSFKRSGFPGADDEFAEVEALFGDALSGGRRRRAGHVVRHGPLHAPPAKAKHPDDAVIAADYSETCWSRRKAAGRGRPERGAVRVDVAQLPFNPIIERRARGRGAASRCSSRRASRRSAACSSPVASSRRRSSSAHGDRFITQGRVRPGVTASSPSTNSKSYLWRWASSTSSCEGGAGLRRDHVRRAAHHRWRHADAVGGGVAGGVR